ncbi:MAG: radical SAM protein, partial [Candidatus Thorarchaeota archaeon]
MSRYRKIIDQQRRPKYLVSKSLSCETNLDASTEDLWRAHRAMSDEFRACLADLDSSEEPMVALEHSSRSFLHLKSELAKRILSNCHFCERRCGADRTRDEKGWCGLGAESRVSSAFLHTGEEAPLVPSGT